MAVTNLVRDKAVLNRLIRERNLRSEPWMLRQLGACEEMPAWRSLRSEPSNTEALDVRNTIIRQMQLMTPIQYEGLLRPAFKQDEWKLIAVGAAIGFLVGELQVLLVLLVLH